MDYRIKPHVPPFVQTPANSVKFEFCNCTTQVGSLALTFSTQVLLYGLVGSQILFVTHTHMAQCQFKIVTRFRLLADLGKCLHFIAIYGNPATPNKLKYYEMFKGHLLKEFSQ